MSAGVVFRPRAGPRLEVATVSTADPLSVLFLCCLAFSATFLLVSVVNGLMHHDTFHTDQGSHGGHIHYHIHDAPHVADASPISHGHHIGEATLHHADNALHAQHVDGVSPGHYTGPGHAGHGYHAHDHDGMLATMDWLSHFWPALFTVFLAALNLISVLTFLFFFGLVGYVLHNALGLTSSRSLLISALAGVVMAGVVGVALRRLYANRTGELTAENSRLEGCIGRVSVAIRPGGVGEVIVAPPGASSQSIPARGADGEGIPVDVEVFVLRVQAGIADVERMDDVVGGPRTKLA